MERPAGQAGLKGEKRMTTASVLTSDHSRQEPKRHRTAVERPCRDPERVARNLARTFVPYLAFKKVSVIPNCIMERSDISLGAKLIWARLAQHGGQDGDCWPAYKRLGEELGITRDRAIDLVKE